MSNHERRAIQVCQRIDAALLGEVDGYLASRVSPEGDGASAEHDPRWLEVLRRSMGHRGQVLISRDAGGAIDGYLPLALVASVLFGRFLVSLPYVNRGGVIASEPAAASALIEEGVRLADRLNVKYLELRHGPAVEHPGLPQRKDHKVRMVLNLPAWDGGKGADALWKAIDTKVRNQVRKGDKSELSVAFGGSELLDGFYDVFAVNMRDLGTPVFPRGLFAAILEVIPGAELVLVRMKDGRAIAGALLIHDARLERMTLVPSASALREFNATNANMWMYHRLLLRAMERGSGRFDFGRSSVDSGTYKFKKQWGAQPWPTVWQYHVRRGDIGELRPDDPRNRRKIEAWQKLPVWLTRLAGPAIIRGIP